MLGGEPGASRSTPAGRRPSDVVQRVEDVIVRNGLRPGDPLPTEVDLCEAVGASRSSVREAIRTLCALDLVEVRHGHGTYVGRMSMDPLVRERELSRTPGPRRGLGAAPRGGGGPRAARPVLRRGLPGPARRAARGELLERLGALAQRLRDLAARGAPWAQEHRAFHLLLAEPLSSGLHSELTGAFHDIAAAMAARRRRPSRPPPAPRSPTSRSSRRPGRGTPRPCTPRSPPTTPRCWTSPPVGPGLSAQSRRCAGGDHEVPEAGRGR